MHHASIGLYFSGTKKDVWLAVDPVSGVKVQTLTMDGTQRTCPSSSRNLLYLGRTGELLCLDMIVCEHVSVFLFHMRFTLLMKRINLNIL